MRPHGATLLVLGMLVACPSSEQEVAGPSVRRLALEPVGSRSPREVLRTRLEVDEETASAWRISCEDGSTVFSWSGPDGGPALEVLALPGTGEREVGIPGPHDPARFNRVVVTYLCRGRDTLEVRLMRDGEVVLAARPVSIDEAPHPDVAVFDVPGTRLLDEPFDEIVLHMDAVTSARDHSVAIAAVELVREDLCTWLPDPEEGARMVRIEHESRRGVALSSEQPLSCRIAPRAGVRLAFSYAIPDTVSIPGQAPVLTVLVGGREQHTFRFPEDGPGWIDGAVALDDHVGSEVDLEFELTVKGEREGLCVVAEARLERAMEAPPTVLLVTSDTHRADYLGVACRGVVVDTPNLDELAAGGVYFEDCLSSTNVTNPSHVALMTATHPRDTGIWNNETALARAAPTLAEAFREAGFVTFAAVSAAHLDHQVSGLGQGFDRMAGPTHDEYHCEAEVSARTLATWLADVEGLPVFAWLHVFDAHTPYTPPGEFDRRYYPADKNPCDPAIELPIDSRLIPFFMSGLRDLAYPEAQYRGEISYLDWVLGGLLALPRLKSAVIAVTADHGEAFGQHGVWWNHGGLYPDTIHVPLILAWPGAPAGTRIARPVQNIDVGRTLLDLAGLEKCAFPGESLLTKLEPGEDRPRFALAVGGNAASVTHDGWHLILNLCTHLMDPPPHGMVPVREKHAVELYHLPDDPECEHDLAVVEHERAAAMRRLLLDWLGDRLAAGWRGEGLTDAEHLRQLAELGYADLDDGPVDERLWVDPECECEHCAAFR